MAPFFETSSTRGDVHSNPLEGASDDVRSALRPPERIRIAVYDSPAVAPRVEDLSFATVSDTIEQLSSTTYNVAREQGGRIPYTVVREVVENLVHADFAEVVVSVMDGGNTLRFSDQGPGIPDKEKAFLPGFSTASSQMKTVIKGVGSGLPIVKEALVFSGGEVEIDDNLGRGSVITLRVASESAPAHDEEDSPEEGPALPRLTTRQKQVLSLAMELGTVGPSLIAKEIRVGLSTAYRDLERLESLGLLVSDAGGKRCLSPQGIEILDDLFK